MKTFLGIYGFIQIITILWWFYTMIITKPKYNNGSNRFLKNWNEGGRFTIILFSFISLLLSLATLLFLAVFNVLCSLV
ncbi:hypothetical protein [Flavobacterium psychrophilum]|uniref:Uncharacterized protein n=1 Tax=Flavobacterium psychrophilum TaxID=96345 RepID=A0A7U2NE27_FLAPS|nr:hypothetical protein [Flavobacterium psychrophilum]QRE03475.1 hypothetical protein H0H26_11380 [Flavobacterium psychrophilum]